MIKLSNFFQQALALSQSIGHRPSEQRMHLHLSELYTELGVYDQALEHIEISHQIAIEDDMLSDRISCLLIAADLHCLHGEYGRAIQIIEQVREISPEGRLTTSLNPLLITLGRAHFGLKEWSTAAEIYQQAQQNSQRTGQKHFVAESLAGLAEVALAQGKLCEAQTHVETILTLLTRIDFDKTSDPLRIYLACYHVLNETGDMRADDVLNEGWQYLQTSAEQIGDQEMKRSFLENIPSHREIAQLRRSSARMRWQTPTSIGRSELCEAQLAA